MATRRITISLGRDYAGSIPRSYGPRTVYMTAGRFDSHVGATPVTLKGTWDGNEQNGTRVRKLGVTESTTFGLDNAHKRGLKMNGIKRMRSI